jgi:hypothetical protein
MQARRGARDPNLRSKLLQAERHEFYALAESQAEAGAAEIVARPQPDRATGATGGRDTSAMTDNRASWANSLPETPD